MIKKGSFPIVNMACAGCAMNIQKTLKQQPGVKDATVNLAGKNAFIEYDASVTNPAQLQVAVRSIGYDLIPDFDDDTEEGGNDMLEKEEKRQYRKLKIRTITAVILSVFLIVLSMTPLMHHHASRYLMALLATPVVFICGRQFFTGAIKQARHKSMNMDTLVALSTSIAYLFSIFSLCFPQFWLAHGLSAEVYFETAAVIITFVLVGRLLEEKAKQKTSSSIQKLIGLRPKTATIVQPDGKVEEVPIKYIQINDIILVKSGEKIAVDGTITEGYSFVDESMITGESLPIEKKQGDPVFAGTINQHGSFNYKAVKVGHETVLAQIIRLVKEAQNSKVPLQKLADKWVAIFVPAVLTIALISALLWLFLDSGNPFVHALLAFVTVLIIACPCALGLATPTAVMVGIGKGAELGILMKDMDSLEVLRKVNTIVLDKTGTITKGIPVVTDAKWFVPETAELRNILFSMEKMSDHPLAVEIASTLQDADLQPSITIETKPGAGITGIIGEKRFYTGNTHLFPSIDEKLTEWIDARENESKTVVLFGTDTQILAAFALADEIKESSRQAIEQLHAAGLEVIMATGDNETTAKEIARQAGIKHYLAKALPNDKLHLIKEKQQEGKIVAMVGDGINDSAALAQANLSIAMGKGSDIAIEVASVTIISGDLRKITAAIRLSKDTVTTIRQNLFWAFIYNIISIPVAAGILYPVNGFLLNPMIAGAAMALSSISVVGNSLRLKWKHS
ncbi:MAG: heavy metal translocating P-type ATPase [Candidatus Symbiothrix sp.]|jgi:Cu2+-exporting ATPase|nr:heavy metal translocating P-type ATPase [Candidatus Symbiothrix sp.]